MLTDADLAAIERRCTAATPGPWRVGALFAQCLRQHEHRRGDCDFRHYWTDDGTEIHFGPSRDGLPYDGDTGDSMVAGQWDYEEGGVRRVEDAQFIAAARQDVPALVAEVRRLRAALRDCVFLWDRGEAIAPDQGEADNARAALGRVEGQ